MNFTRENFISFCREIIRNGMSFDLESYGGDLCFGYFEMKPYASESTIRYNVKSISKYEGEIGLLCSVRIGEFNVGKVLVDEYRFLRYAKEVCLYGSFDKDLMDIITKYQTN